MSRLLDYFELDGDILQTHIESPRSTAYLASLFYSVNRVNNFYVYGAGPNLKEYRRYMDTLGISNIRLFAEPFTSFPIESNRFATVVGIFVNPPNSFSAISDPIDLICSRGGDLSMLEVLTETEISDDGRQRVALILEEQLLTLQMAMSRPHVQFLLYQTHSMVTSENLEMVEYAVALVNRIALEKHRCAFRERKRLEALAEAEAANIPSAALNLGSPRKRAGTMPAVDDKTKTPQPNVEGQQAPEAVVEKPEKEETEEDVVLPDIDEFELDQVPDICINQDSCFKMQASGCYFSLIKRRSITRLNAKYLIKMAEVRGLFGQADGGKSAKPKVVKPQEIHVEKPMQPDLLAMRKEHKTSFNVDNLLSKSALRTKYWWHYAFKRLKATQNIWKILQKPKNIHHVKSKVSRKLPRRQPFPIHVNEIKILIKLRRSVF